MEIFTAEGFAALLQVIGIDLVLAGDNAIVIGLAAAGLPARAAQQGDPRRDHRRHGAAHRLRAHHHAGSCSFGGAAPDRRRHPAALGLLEDVARAARRPRAEETAAEEALAGRDLNADGTVAGGVPRKTFGPGRLPDHHRRRVDVARQRARRRRRRARAPDVLIFGLVLSVALMGLASTFIARLHRRYRWIAYMGVAIILYVAARMMWDGYEEIQNPHDAGEPEAAASDRKARGPARAGP